MLKNIASTVFSHYSSQVLSLVANILLARYLGGEGFGEYALISSIFLIGNAFTTFGMDMVLIRVLAAGFDARILGDGLLVQLLLSALYIVAVFIFDLFIPVTTSLKIYIFSLVPLSFYTIFTIVVRARLQMQVYAAAQVLISLFQLIVAIIFPFLNGNIDTLAWLFLLSYIVIAWWGYRFYAAPFVKVSFSFVQILDLLRKCFQMAAIGTVRLIYEKISAAILPGLVGLTMAGLFSASSRLMTSGKLGYYSAYLAIYPEMTKDVEMGKKMKGLLPLLGTSMVFSIFIFIFAKPLILFLFGNDFLPAVSSLQIMAWSIIPYVLIAYLTLGLSALGLEKPILISSILALIVLLILLVILTIELGIVGSSIAILAAELIYAGNLWHQWRTHVLSKLP